MGVQGQDKESWNWDGNKHKILSSPFNMEICSCVSHIVLFNIKNKQNTYPLFPFRKKNLYSGK